MLVAEYNINPWELDKLTAKDLQHVAVAERAKQYIQEHQQRQHDSSTSATTHGQQRTPQGTRAQQAFVDKWGQ